MRLVHVILALVGVFAVMVEHAAGGPGSGAGSLAGPTKLILVPRDYPTIQGAIDAAPNGATIMVSPGTYVENIDFRGKRVRVRSARGPAVTVIDGNQSGPTAFFGSGELPGTELRGFTITNGSSGGILCEYGSSPTIADNVISGNTNVFGGGIHIRYDCGPTIARNQISNNVCTETGGGILVERNSPALILGNYISDNVVSGTLTHFGGGGIEIVECSPVVVGNTIVSNEGRHFGGGIYVYYQANPIIANNIIANNSAREGGGFACRSGSYPIVTNNTIYGNTATNTGGGAFGGAPVFANTIVWGNTPNQLVSGLSATFCNVQGGYPGTGNKNEPPALMDPANLDFHLTSASPCIDAGNNTALGIQAEDIDGDARIIGGTVDIGADEYLPKPVVTSVSPWRSKYDKPVPATITGQFFTQGAVTEVRFGGVAATSVVVVDDATITCAVPAGTPGHVSVEVESSLGTGLLEDGFAYTPTLTVTGDFQPGGTLDLEFLCNPGDSIWAIYGGLPQQNLQTPPFSGTLCILPFQSMFLIQSWPFDEFNQTLNIPNDGALSGVTVLMQGLVGPSLSGQKDAAWTNCGVVEIQ
ncbi:MAG: hypothetical protein DWP92_10110 [Armatimonadetes bacterium]|nr:MAG: hypothetical protein DWP92_10110 [Armatimonadota bacterium]